MPTSRTTPRRSPSRRKGWLVAVLAGLLAALTAWAPGAVAEAGPVLAGGGAAGTTVADAATPRGDRGRDASSQTIAPGDPIFSGGARCTAGFNVTDGTDVFIVTAGHCTSVGSTWYADPQLTVPIGPTVSSSFPGNDYGLIRYDNPDLTPEGGYGLGSPYVGRQVYIRTSQTGIHSGTITALNATIDYGPDGVVHGLIRTNICLPVGAGGGTPLFGHNDQALGIASGGSGSCSSGGTTFFQPLNEVLSSFGLMPY
ncbi:serine protease [Streptomyces sp. RKND-216]|uniref:S1 family peptidase n=1 Tax=Streptomyces sp. RKND-216 TaxID=2562581 RepID=UPI00109DE7F8|nr:S1 family peptidase [Streptomyces sp. RKND-216]THA23756.1 serine protease [Streptomyces sp. RKND-216]